MNLLITALTPIIWGTTYFVTTEFLPPDRPILAGFLRAFPAGLMLLAWFRILPSGHWWWKAIVLGVVNIGAFFAFLFWAAYLLPGGVAAVVTNTSPLWVIALSPIILKTRIKPMHVIAAFFAITGVMLLVLGPGAALNPQGVAVGLAGSLLMALGIVLAKKFGRPEGVPGLAVTGWQLIFGGLFLAPLLLWEGLPAQLSVQNLGGYAYLCIIGAVLAYGIWFRGIALLDTVSVAMLGVLSPLTATFLGVVFNGETLSAPQWGGAAAVVLALLVANLGAAGGGRRQASFKETAVPPLRSE